MSTMRTNQTPGSLVALRRLMDSKPRQRAGEVCEMCNAAIAAEHAHVVNVETRQLLCSCRSCYLLFTASGAARGKLRAVPDRYLSDSGFVLSEAQWERFQIPVRIAFFFYNSALEQMVAFYPSPAGATQSTRSLEAWQDLVDSNPMLADLQPDVEALLVYGRRDQPFQCYLVPIDACYELTGLIKWRWRGFDGGAAAWKAIDGFFETLHGKSHNVRAA